MILVNSFHPRGRKRFPYAHEYGHALLDRDQRGQNITISSDDNSSKKVERRANAFAVAFLMPRNGFYEALQSLGKDRPSCRERTVFDDATRGHVEAELHSAAGSQRITCKDIAILAHHFGVSYQAALDRSKSLRYVSRRESQKLSDQEDIGREFL